VILRGCTHGNLGKGFDREEKGRGLFLNNIDFMVLVLDSTQSLNSKLQSMWMNKIDSSHSFPLYFEFDIFQLNRPRKTPPL
jgi:hypothetical protein